MKKLVALILAVVCVFTAFAESGRDSVTVYFRVSQATISPAVGENAAVTAAFIKRVEALNTSGDLERISIYGYASPEGPLKLNESLARRRSEALAADILKHSTVDADMVSIYSGGIAWGGLKEMVENSDELARRGEILDILNTPGLSSEERLRRLQQVGRGVPYRWMLRTLFPRLRYTKAVAVYRVPDEPCIQEQDTVAAVVDATAASDTVASHDVEVATIPVDADTAVTVAPYDRKHLLAIKTNLLYYFALMPNLSVEWLITKNWSVAVEGNVAWWSNESKLKCYRIATVDAEGRYWVRPRDYWHGFYVGAFAGWGEYDLENGGNGHQGEGVMAGATIGYMWPVRHNISFEVGIGAGYLYTRDKEYKPFEGHYVYQRSKSINYFGPLKVKFAFVWRFLDRNKAKKKGVERW